MSRSRIELVVENALLRQQLIVLNRQFKRPQLTNPERFRLVFLSRCTALLRENWATFLKNQASDIWACDFTVVNDWLFRQWYVVVVMELKTRRMVYTGVTKYPTDEWTAQQLREATPWGKGPKYLIRDRDSKYATHFSTVAVGSRIKELKTPYRTPQVNGICKRFMGSLRRECLDYILIHDDQHFRRVVKE